MKSETDVPVPEGAHSVGSTHRGFPQAVENRKFTMAGQQAVYVSRLLFFGKSESLP